MFASVPICRRRSVLLPLGIACLLLFPAPCALLSSCLWPVLPSTRTRTRSHLASLSRHEEKIAVGVIFFLSKSSPLLFLSDSVSVKLPGRANITINKQEPYVTAPKYPKDKSKVRSQPNAQDFIDQHRPVRAYGTYQGGHQPAHTQRRLPGISSKGFQDQEMADQPNSASGDAAIGQESEHWMLRPKGQEQQKEKHHDGSAPKVMTPVIRFACIYPPSQTDGQRGTASQRTIKV